VQRLAELGQEPQLSQSPLDRGNEGR
jgi:hypothetical protein